MFVDSDTVSEFKSEDGAVHVIERRCKLDIDAPRLLKKVTGGHCGSLGGGFALAMSHELTAFPPYLFSKDRRSRLRLFCPEKLAEFSRSHFAH